MGSVAIPTVTAPLLSRTGANHSWTVASPTSERARCLREAPSRAHAAPVSAILDDLTVREDAVRVRIASRPTIGKTMHVASDALPVSTAPRVLLEGVGLEPRDAMPEGRASRPAPSDAPLVFDDAALVRWDAVRIHRVDFRGTPRGSRIRSAP